jgi:hypothetical protein
MDSELAFLGGGVGLERFLLMQEGKTNILELSMIKPLADLIRKNSKNTKPNEKAILLVEEILRLMHHLVCEQGGISEGLLGKSRKSIIAKLVATLICCIVALELKFDRQLLKTFMKLDVELRGKVDGQILKFKENNIDLIFEKINEKLIFYKNSEIYKKEISDKIERYKLK